MNRNLDRIEAHLRILFEDSLIMIFTGKHNQTGLIDDLINVMRENLRENKDGQIIAPDRFILYVSPDDDFEWRTHQDILDKMAATIYSSGLSEGVTFFRTPTIEIIASQNVLEDHFSISATISRANDSLPDTAAMEQPVSAIPANPIPENASLIVGGNENFPLDKAVINIGRHSDNDLVLEDQYISRHHVQIRAIKNQYVIFDVGSVGGTYLNGKKIIKASLHPGDVIRIGSVNLIYIQDTITSSPTSVMPVDSEENYAGRDDQ